jgi:hypothetical protein
MPAKSEQQRKWAFGVKGPAWAKKHHMDNAAPVEIVEPEPPAELDPASVRLMRLVSASDPERKHLRGGL